MRGLAQHSDLDWAKERITGLTAQRDTLAEALRGCEAFIDAFIREAELGKITVWAPGINRARQLADAARVVLASLEEPVAETGGVTTWNAGVWVTDDNMSEAGDATIDLDELTQDGLSLFDLQHLTEIIREGYGLWYHADLMRCLHLLLPHADATNMRRLQRAYPGSVAAYKLWYNDPTGFAVAVGERRRLA